MHSPLATPTSTRAVLDRHAFNLKKSLGQNFLINDAIIGKIIELAQVNANDYVLEVGPGIGTLTYALLSSARFVTSIERDVHLPAVLDDTLADHSEKLMLIGADALDVNSADLELDGEMPNKLVSNLPYAVAATIVLDYFERIPSISSMTVMVQKEVADRMMATPGNKNYGAYTVKLSMYAEYAGSFNVAPSNFMPPPHVESTVIRLDRRESGEATELVKAACTMADAAFFARRKTVANSCKQYFSGRDASIVQRLPAIFESAGISPQLRGETLSREDFIALGRALLDVL